MVGALAWRASLSAAPLPSFRRTFQRPEPASYTRLLRTVNNYLMMPPMTTRKRKKGKREPISHLRGWQTVTDAERQSGTSRQRIHVLVKQKRIPHREILGIKLVPNPLPDW